ncbi:hypothetical protein RBH29_05905 [Herbivorax sp. ANBcel31]|uniref:hypothetical protein n=1 Tax=Herbivorax sp. ANBcel31 TaxID=3069754 RepID=UPI0027B6E6E7|nr:hypothetical protein [Herbivorax sp. ANBcel31]MDQ2085973.1 hypothetical protein [Herbivorax sp. ANBcel31]
MFYQVRYQTGEIKDVAKEMKTGKIPCMDVKDMDEFMWVTKELVKQGVFLVESIPFDKSARNPIKEPEFEFRAAFSSNKPDSNNPIDKDNFMYIDFYFDPYEEKDYQSIFGD